MYKIETNKCCQCRVESFSPFSLDISRQGEQEEGVGVKPDEHDDVGESIAEMIDKLISKTSVEVRDRVVLGCSTESNTEENILEIHCKTCDYIHTVYGISKII